MLLFVFLLFAIACEVKSVATEPVAAEVKTTMPFDERKFIYNNGIKAENKEVITIDEKKVKTNSNYLIISGLKDKSVQNKINIELEKVGKKLLKQLEVNLLAMKKNGILNYNQKNTYAYISYNFNNVIFIEYSANIDTRFKDNNHYPNYKYISYGYDLNTGGKIELNDIFKPGIDYKTKINNFICQYIIDNNYDDYKAERMSKPFQGIRENQSFSFDFEGLRIILDEKNDDFVYNGYSDQILIPLKYLGDDLYIFDKYYDESKNIFEKEKLSKKLFPNQIEFKVNNIIQEGNEKYFIEITQGEFINISNKDIEKKLNEMVVSRFDIEDFKERAKALTGVNENSHFGHFVNIFTNAGGYLSMTVSQEVYLKNKYELKRTPFNYDFNMNKEIMLSDIFVKGAEIDSIIKAYIKNMNYPVTEEMLEVGIEEAMISNNFYFDEYGIAIYFSPKNAKLEEYQKWVRVPFEAFGIENIAYLN